MVKNKDLQKMTIDKTRIRIEIEKEKEAEMKVRKETNDKAKIKKIETKETIESKEIKKEKDMMMMMIAISKESIDQELQSREKNKIKNQEKDHSEVKGNNIENKKEERKESIDSTLLLGVMTQTLKRILKK